MLLNQKKDPPKLLSESEAAEILKVPPNSLRRWRWSGGGPPFIKLPGGRSVRYDAADLNDWLDSGRRTSTSDPGRSS